jgi:hypothetical protein
MAIPRCKPRKGSGWQPRGPIRQAQGKQAPRDRQDRWGMKLRQKVGHGNWLFDLGSISQRAVQKNFLTL